MKTAALVCLCVLVSPLGAAPPPKTEAVEKPEFVYFLEARLIVSELKVGLSAERAKVLRKRMEYLREQFKPGDNTKTLVGNIDIAMEHVELYATTTPDDPQSVAARAKGIADLVAPDGPFSVTIKRVAGVYGLSEMDLEKSTGRWKDSTGRKRLPN
jgi:hypothetical protein